MSGRFSHEVVESVRNAGDIVRVISDYVPLKQAGSRLKGLCPFHQEKTPSFSVDPNAQLFYCFGCQTGGDIFKFVMEYEKLAFPEAVEQLANRFGVNLPRDTHGGDDDTSQRVLEINKATARFFRSLLTGDESGAGCRAYLEQRGITDETSEKLGIGYAPDAWEGLRTHLVAKKHNPADLKRAGLVLERKSGQGEYDRFRQRLIFPIRDVNSRPIAFGGRALGDAEPKYINSPETPVYTKGQHLYGLDLAHQAIRREGFALIVEGYLDLAAVLQGGFDNVVASLGTAFTPQQARLLARYTERVVVSYDGDAAGAKATARSLDLLLEKGFEVRVVELPGGFDPDDTIREHGAETYAKLVRSAPEYLEFLVRREARSRDLNQAGEKVAAVNAVLPHLARISNAIERSAWAARLADAIQIEDELVMQELRKAIASARPQIRQRPAVARPPAEAESRLVSVLLRSRTERERWAEELDLEEIRGTQVSTIVETILTMTREGKPVDHQQVLSALEEDVDRDLLTRIAFRDDPEEGPTVEDCLWTFRREGLRRKEREALKELGKLQQLPDQAEIDQRLQQLQRLARERDAHY